MVSLLKRLGVLLLFAPFVFAQANLPNGTTASGDINWKNISAPSTPASGRTLTWTDSTSKLFCAKDDAGTLSCTVIPSSAPSHQFFNSLSAGAFGSAQPGFSDLSGSLSCAQLPSFTGDMSNTACAVTVTALHLGSTPTLCSSGNYSRGIDANGNATGCTSASGGSGTVTSIATTTPISGGTITTTGTISCPTCAIGPGSSTANHLAKFSGTDGLTLADGGAIPAGTVTSVATTSPITGGTITGSGTVACATCVTASSPGAGIAHFAGSTQAVTSSAVSLTGDVSGTLPVANGGTGVATLAAHGVVVGNTTSAVTVTAAGTAGQCLMSNGASSDPSYQACGSGTVTGTASYPGMATFQTVPSSLTWVNQGTSTQDNTGGYLVLTPQSGTFSVRLLVKSIPAFTTNVTLIVAYQLETTTGNSWGGLALRESSSGKLVSSVGNYTNMQWAKWTNETSFNSNYFTSGASLGPVIWEKLVIDATNKSFYVSVDGNDWLLISQTSKTDFCTPNQWGISANTGVIGHVKYLSWQEIVN